MMKQVKVDDTHLDLPVYFIVKVHPRSPEYPRLDGWEKQRTVNWTEQEIFRPGVSKPLDLFERAGWAKCYPQNLRFAK